MTFKHCLPLCRVALLVVVGAAASPLQAGSGPASSRPPPVSRSGILYLYLDPGAPEWTLRSAKVYPGVLRPRRGRPPRESVHYLLESAGGEEIGRGWIPEPGALRRDGFEYLGDDGRLHRPETVPEPDVVLLRVPYSSDIGRIRLFSTDPGGSRSRATPASPAGPEPDLGTIRLDPQDLRFEESLGPASPLTAGPISFSNRIKVVYLGDGFTASDLSLFPVYALSAYGFLMGLEPFTTYASYFESYRISIVSRESGTDHPAVAPDEPYPGQVFSADTFLDSSFDNGVHRCIYVGNVTLGYDVLGGTLPSFDIPNVIVNHGWRGGCAGEFAVSTIHGDSPGISAHELAHTFAGLSDEYEISIYSAQAYNVTKETVRELIPWNYWIDPLTPVPTPEDDPQYWSVVGLFKGAAGQRDWYRPKFNCMMRETNQPFCEVCRERIVQVIYSHVSPIDDWSPPEDNLTLGGTEQMTLTVVPMEPADHSLDVAWSVDGLPVPGADSTAYLLSGADLSPGPHTVTATVSDPTPFVINDPEGLLEDTRSWTVERLAATPATKPSAGSVFLGPGRPNPFTRSLSVGYRIETGGPIRLAVFDARGRRVAVLVEGYVEPGEREAVWNGRTENGTPAAQGFYFLRLETREQSLGTKILLLR